LLNRIKPVAPNQWTIKEVPPHSISLVPWSPLLGQRSSLAHCIQADRRSQRSIVHR
jgi:hypothetical protein